jgi:nitrite reductase/ring-hydroxylating ferredoxin subunit/uncharacterized membrane protein
VHSALRTQHFAVAPVVLAPQGMGTNEVVRALGDQEWLDGVADPVQQAVRKLFESAGEGGRQLKNFLHGSALGHPLHPALIDLPLGSWTLAAILDGMEVTRGRKKNKAADTAIGVGLIGAVAAAIAGITDWSETDARAKRIGATHGVMNLAATALYATSLFVRRRSRSQGIGLSMIAYAVAASAAYLGGHLTYGEQIGVDHTATADQGTPEKFVAVLDDDQLPADKPTKVTADGVSVVLVRQGDAIYALRDTCSHLGGPLSEGKLEGNSIICPWHGSRFCLEDGRVLDGPAVFPERTFDIRVREGKIEFRARA